MGKKREEKPEFSLISYSPLLWSEAGKERVALQSVLSNNDIGRVESCLWAADTDGAAYPVFIMKQAEAIREHLIAWSEEKPAEWFDLAVVDLGDRYAVVLWPRLYRSVERFKTAWLNSHSEFLPSDHELKILFRPLNFVSIDSGMLGKCRDKIGKQSKVCFLDSSNFDKNDPAKSGEPMLVGVFNVSFEHTMAKQYIQGQCEQTGR